MTPSSATLDEKALEAANAAFSEAHNVPQQCYDCAGTGRHSDESTCRTCEGNGWVAPKGWDPMASAIRAYMSALTVTSFPPAEQHDVTSHAVPHDGEGAVASDFMSLAAHLAKVNAGRPVVEGSETGVYVHRDVCIEAMQALLASSPTPPTAPAVPAGVTLWWVRSPGEAQPNDNRDLFIDEIDARAYSSVQSYPTEVVALSALPAQPNSSEGEPI